MSLCPNTGKACGCQPQDGVMCPYGPTPNDWTPWKPEPEQQEPAGVLASDAPSMKQQLSNSLAAHLRERGWVEASITHELRSKFLPPEQSPDSVHEGGIRYTSWCDKHRRATPCDKCAAAGVAPTDGGQDGNA